jgi:3-dehydroquinate dehydratase-1
MEAAPRLEIPLIITVRHPAEGGVGRMTITERQQVFRMFLPHAAMIDVEARSLGSLVSTLSEARKTGVKLICSDHHFRATPSVVRMKCTIQTARRVGASVCKIAARTDRSAEILKLLALFSTQQRIGLSVMGMGKLGKVSRLLFAQAGSVLNYGYLHAPNASGQWEATLLKQRLVELAEE